MQTYFIIQNVNSITSLWDNKKGRRFYKRFIVLPMLIWPITLQNFAPVRYYKWFIHVKVQLNHNLKYHNSLLELVHWWIHVGVWKFGDKFRQHRNTLPQTILYHKSFEIYFKTSVEYLLHCCALNTRVQLI